MATARTASKEGEPTPKRARPRTRATEAPRAEIRRPSEPSRGGLEAYGLVIAAFAILLLLSLVSFDARDVGGFRHREGGTHNLIGPVGAHLAHVVMGAIGLWSFVVCSTFFFFAGVLLAGRRIGFTGGGVTAYVLGLVSGAVVLHLVLGGFRPFAHPPGGVVGEWAGEVLRALFATTGTLIIGVSILAVSTVRLSGLGLVQAARMPYRALRVAGGWVGDMLRPAPPAPPNPNDPTEKATRVIAPDPDAVDPGASPPVDAVGERAGRGATTARDGRAPKRQRANVIAEKPGWLPPPEAGLGEDRETRRHGAGPAPTDGPVVEAPLAAAPASVASDDTAPARPANRPPAASAGAPAQAAALDDAPDAEHWERSEDDDAAALTPVPPARAAVAPAGPKPGSRTPALADGPMIAAPVPHRPPPLIPEQNNLPLGGPMVYEFPSLSLLDYHPPARDTVDPEALRAAARVLEEKLADFGVKGEVTRIQPGPVVTMFEFLPAPGVKISKIQNLSDDLTMALHAQRVRIVAPIPGKGVVGIEVPSMVRETVFLKEVLASDEFQSSTFRLPISLGKDIVGNAVLADLAKAPHLLVAGATGAGKSVAINAFICSLLYRLKPKDLRMIFVDPKMLELSIYDDIPHLLLPVVTEPKKASLALKWAVAEMERRYRLLAAFAVRNIAGFNVKVEKIKEGGREAPEGVAPDEVEHLPYIVIILDELADLMMVAGKEVEQSIARLAQMARAAGIHIIVATQRPSVDVITGLIKANFPTRISFQVAQKVDSRTILDRSGAENLLGQGDMLFLPPGTSRIQRIQGCFVSDDEVERIVKHLKQFGPPDYDLAILVDDESEQKDLSGEDYDPKFDEAVQIVCETGNPSISYLQRRLKIGYNRSARIIERMEFDGIVSPADHRGGRKVLAPGAPDLE